MIARTTKIKECIGSNVLDWNSNHVKSNVQQVQSLHDYMNAIDGVKRVVLSTDTIESIKEKVTAASAIVVKPTADFLQMLLGVRVIALKVFGLVTRFPTSMVDIVSRHMVDQESRMSREPLFDSSMCVHKKIIFQPQLFAIVNVY